MKLLYDNRSHQSKFTGSTKEKFVKWQNEKRERKQHTISELQKTDDIDVKIVCLADKLSNIRSISRDYAVLGEKLWERFNAGKSEQAWYYRVLAESLSSLSEYSVYREFVRLVEKVFG